MPTDCTSSIRHFASLFAVLWLAVISCARAGSDGITPLMLAASAGDLETLHRLLAEGTAVDDSDARGHTAAWHAVNARKPAALAALLEAGRALTGHCVLGRDALRRAMELGDWALIQPMLAAGRDNLGWTLPARRLMAKAVRDRQAERIRALLQKHWREPVAEGSRHPMLAHAVRNGDIETTAFLLDCGCDPNTRIGNLADPEFTDRVPQKFIRYYLKDDRGATVLMLAAGMQRTAIAKLLVARGARVSTCTLGHKMAALSFAAQANDHETMRVLIGACPLPEQLRVEISLLTQTATVFKNNQPIESTPISTGIEGKETKPGRFLITNKSPMHESTLYKGAKMPFFMRLNCGDSGMHQGVVTGSPASHGCIRLPGSIAKRWYEKLPLGTTVTVY